jgi:hypothetical protein
VQRVDLNTLSREHIAHVKTIHLIFSLIASALLLVIVFTAGFSRPKAIIGMGAFAGAFWYLYISAPKKAPNPSASSDNRSRDWMGNPHD